MSGVSMPVIRPMGRALVVASPSSRAPLLAAASKVGFDCGECDDPYTATLELSRRRLVYRALVLSLGSLYREELALITTVKRRMPHLEIWLAHTDGRQAALAEAMRLGAEGLIDDEGLHRIATPSETQERHVAAHELIPTQPPPAQTVEQIPDPLEVPIAEPVLTAEELRALLQDQTAMPPSGGSEL